MRAFSCLVFVLVRVRINKGVMTTIDLPPSLALSDDEEGLDYGKDGDDDKEEEHHSRGASGRAGGGSGVRNWHLDEVNAWKAKRALIRKRKEKEARQLKKQAAKAAAAKAAGPKQDS